ncbi:hypothetical protein BD779DRAFT_1501659 [Infundibulicybe gibba]|nr:hypothetical protein BD779DRAFT_1501659 [Infundibulicybe gibba]
MTLLPAHHTKHIPLLPYPFRELTFHLAQSDDGVSNGTALWLGAQCLSLYLIEAHTKFRPPTAACDGLFGWDVLATDIDHVISTVLARNIGHNVSQLPRTSGQIAIRELDWTVLPDQWSWDDSAAIASESRSTHHAHRISSAALSTHKRDPALLDRALSEAKNIWNFSVQRIPHHKLAKAIGKAGSHWDREDWEDVEIWKLVLLQR